MILEKKISSSSFCVLADHDVEPFRSVTTNSTKWEIEFLKWISLRKELFGPPSIRSVEIEGKKISRAAVELKIKSSLGQIIGCGRSEHLSTALTKAYVEALERMAVHCLYEDYPSHSSLNKLRTFGRKISVLSQTKDTLLPPRSILSTNGWALHYDLDIAICNAFNEATERHLLLLNFIKYGWKAFNKVSTFSLLGRDVILLKAGLSQANREGGILVTKLKNHAGVTMGFLCDFEGELSSSNRINHAILEAIEPAIFLDSKPAEFIHSELESKDPLSRTQAHYALSEFSLNDVSFSLNQVKRDSLGEIEASSLFLNLQDCWELPFPLYAVFVFGEEMLPLTFASDLTSDAKDYVYKILARYGKELEFPDVHPIL